MAIDWITVSAQIVNFLILVWLLKRFLYQPVIQAMDRRERHIAERVEEADRRERQASESMLDFQDRSEALDRQRQRLLAEARQEADREKRRLIDFARDEVNGTRSEWLRQIADEKEAFLGDLRRRITGTVEAIARHALQDLAGTTLEEQIVQRFCDRLRALDDGVRGALVRASGPLRVVTAFKLAAALRGRLARALHDCLGTTAEVDFRQSPELLCGIELQCDGHRLGWSLADYLDLLGERMEEAFRPADAAGAEGRRLA